MDKDSVTEWQSFLLTLSYCKRQRKPGRTMRSCRTLGDSATCQWSVTWNETEMNWCTEKITQTSNVRRRAPRWLLPPQEFITVSWKHQHSAQAGSRRQTECQEFLGKAEKPACLYTNLPHPAPPRLVQTEHLLGNTQRKATGLDKGKCLYTNKNWACWDSLVRKLPTGWHFQDLIN